MDLIGLKIGARVQTKKPHPCGGLVWEVVRTGADWKIKCQTCGRCVMLTREELERRVRLVLTEAGNGE